MTAIQRTVNAALASSIASVDDLVAAIESAPSGSTLNLRPGRYEVSLRITRPLTVRGSGNETVLVGLPGSGPVIEICSHDVRILDVAIQCLDRENGIAIRRPSSVGQSQLNVTIQSGRVLIGGADRNLLDTVKANSELITKQIVRHTRGVLSLVFKNQGERASIQNPDPQSTPSVNETKRVSIGPDTVIEMVRIEPGGFLMGSPAREFGRQPDENQVLVTLTKPFFIGKFPVTQRQWAAIMGENPSSFQQSLDSPVDSVSYDRVIMFLHRLNHQTHGMRFRLPTEAEWEYACRAGGQGPFGGTGNVNEMGWFDLNSRSRTWPVGQKQHNAWGLHDMHGNVAEWCADYYGTYPADPQTDPTGRQSSSRRVYRGGAWNATAPSCRSASRGAATPDRKMTWVGFRLVLDA